MPIIFIASGLVLIISGLKGSPDDLWELVKGDFSGPNNYVYWMISILILGGLGYAESLRGLSRLFMALVVIVLLLDNKGFFAQLQAFIDSGNSTEGTSSTK